MQYTGALSNILSIERRAQVVSCLVEGMSTRATVRVTGVAKNTIVKLLAELGAACAEYQDAALANLDSKVIECDEIWSFCYAKQRTFPGSTRAPPATATCGRGSRLTSMPSWSRRGWQVSARKPTPTRSCPTSEPLEGPFAAHHGRPSPYLTIIEPLFDADSIDFAMLHK